MGGLSFASHRCGDGMFLVQLKQLRASLESFRVSYDTMIQWRAQATKCTNGRSQYTGPSYWGCCAGEGYSEGRFRTSDTNPDHHQLAETNNEF